MHTAVLVAEDDREVSALIARYLGQEGCIADIADDGSAAFALLESRAYQLVILDIMLPQIDGLSLLRRIRSQDNTPVIIVSARGEEVDKVNGLEMGADDYIVKPFSINELMARVRVQLRKSIHPDSPLHPIDSISYGDISIDRSALIVRKAGTPVSLTSTEYHILKLLIENPGKVFTKSQIREQVWRDTVFLEDNTIMVHIRNIRKKIELDPAEPEIIKTVWGFGYAVGV